ncbi:spore photoproduct lyase family protein [Microbacterium sp. EYE_5]|uniref:spore photoproduct lyase family protein n=1 Tax=unclassified Microbacterium TaxID=2609290 RepID=UPI002005C6FC|nr:MULTISPECIES: spore photoproduct lyase family protein [unclassified Microbacterium]MCK6079427.1 spore photoproduct lyase family protein [Microbacterium sp. EYE_382]MCK6084697.1 spore photoproduct lyase family protein [Microbacterium sp. EYE_384]MCK6123074.1 spore photoproduct lyase family protein [Microbacterium sp. EYE_80]MCK6125461.1 spore photoproduct lyase family protein [Microbacterium sp. EYE_79]MCK6140381.1 spore photoproduct lyase family protein [Microbacterium sp. EYE_39]
MRPASALLDVRRIYAEPAAAASARGLEILARWPDATVVPIASHWQIPEVHGDERNVARWVRIKTEALVLGEKKSVATRVNGRSADFIAPSTANGCAMACAYCYVPRRKGYSNPVTVFTNIERITSHLARHVQTQGAKVEPNQCDPDAWVYDIGENSDCSVDAMISDNVRDLCDLFRMLPTAKASFATKYVNRDLLEWDPMGRTRIRFSLMPHETAKVTDIRTSPIAERIAAIDDFVAAGYEVHLNFSPIILTPTWVRDWSQLLQHLADVLTPATKAQLAAEVIFLTHNEQLHEVNLGWHPKAEELLWTPALQEAKVSQNGAVNVRYRAQAKAAHIETFRGLVARYLPECRIRYAF